MWNIYRITNSRIFNKEMSWSIRNKNNFPDEKCKYIVLYLQWPLSMTLWPGSMRNEWNALPDINKTQNKNGRSQRQRIPITIFWFGVIKFPISIRRSRRRFAGDRTFIGSTDFYLWLNHTHTQVYFIYYIRFIFFSISIHLVCMYRTTELSNLHPKQPFTLCWKMLTMKYHCLPNVNKKRYLRANQLARK